MREVNTDIVIVGAGIAGLWMLNTLSKQGYDVLLLEAESIGSGQSVKSQGIIHGGIKYALNGVLSQASDAIKGMPARWRACLTGEGELDLRGVTTLSDAHYLWSQGSLAAKITSFFAKKAMSGRVDSIDKNDYPKVFAHPDFKGNLYKLNEIVLDVPSLLKVLSEKQRQRILQIDTADCQWDRDHAGNITAVSCLKEGIKINAQRFVFAAGQGNAAILKQLKMSKPEMQLRPLHMAMVTHNTNLPIYAHCIAASSKPLVTITHHINSDGSYTWYYGGDIAETGMGRDSQQQIIAAKELTAKILPWVTLENARWSTLHISRAEPKQSGLSRPDAAYCHSEKNYLVTWPTKLALTPDLGDKVSELFSQQQLKAQYRADLEITASIKSPPISAPAWSDTGR
ncbi:FAD-dependent oxidoreductase ['Osedax' symbiont bacterium Rs2_46_30_T18]|nr:FAD-dependent oxidoreductase ['Osedax' symbiont bacterium Rs2_46_30_T18]